MASNPTIIAASLNDEELRKSIDKLVNHVDDQLHYMVASTKVNVKSINDALDKIGDVDTKLGSKGSKSGGTSKQVKAQEELAESVDKTTSKIKKQGEVSEMTFDQMRSSIEKAIRVPSEMRMPDMAKSARESFIAFQHGYKEQAQQIFQSITKAENALNDVVARRIERLKQQLEETKRKLNELYSVRTIQESYEGSGLRTNTQKLDTQIERQLLRIKELEEQIAAASNGMVSPEMSARLGALRAEYARISNIMKEDVTTRQQSTSATQQQLTAEQKLTDEIRKQAEEIRKSKEWQEKGYAYVGDRVVYNPDMPPKGWTKRQIQEMLPLEGQLLEIQRQQLSEQSKQTSEKHAQANVEKTLQQEALGRYQIEKDYYEQLKKGREIQREMQAQKGNDAYYAQLSSVNMLNAKLKELRSLYADMGASERVGARGEQVAQQIRDITRQVQKMNAELSRPKSLREALRLPEKDLDDLAYKIRQLQAYMRGLDTSNEKNAALFNKAALNAKLLKERENELLQKNSQLIYSNGQLFKSNTALGRSWNYMKNRLAFYFTVGASTAFIRNLIEVRSQYEMNERALGILINSAERGTQIFNELSQMALVSPYTLIELSSAAKQLTAYDIAAKDVVDTTRRLADMASAVGVPIERLTYALGQIKAYGYLNSRDNRMFANAGIPLVKQLADYYTELEGRLVSTADVYDRIKKKAVSYEDTMQVINRMTDEGGRFFDFQAKMADTLKVQLANLTLAWNNMLNDIGASQQGLLTAGIGTLKDLFLAWKELSKVLETVAIVFGLVKAQQMFANVAIGKGTVALLSYVAANKAATWQEYVRVLQTKKLTAAQAAWLVMTNQNNAALAAAVVRLKILDASMVRSLVSLKGLSLGFARLRLGGLMALNGLVKGVKSLGAAFMSNLPLLAMTALIDAFMYAKNIGEEALDFNKELANGAKESAKSLGDFLKESDKVQARAAAASKTLAEGEANKMWEALREQIELSSAAAKQLIPELLQVPDINERVTKAFILADKIQEANEKLSDLKNELDVNQDSWMWGAFGEGLVEDIEDYAERRRNEIEEEKYWASDELDIWKDLKYTVRGFWDGIMVGTEAFQEITKFANNAADVIREKLGKDGVRDANMVAEAIARVIAETEKKYPRIQGAGKNLFEATVTEVMSQQFAGAYKAQEFYYTKFLEQLKKDYAHTFSGVSDDIIDNAEHKWNPAQIKAIEETAKKIKTDMPEASRAAIDAIVKQLDSTDFKLHFVATFESNRSDLQRQFDRDFGDPVSGETLGDYKSLRPKESEDILEYRKNLNKTLEDGDKRYKDLVKQQKAVGGSNAALAKSLENEAIAQQKVNNAARHIKDSWHLLDEEKKKSTRGSKKDILGDALAKEVQLIGEIQKRYKEYQQMGVNAQEAVTLATEEYGNTLRRTNATLAKYGIATKSSDELAGMDIREVRDYYKALLEGAKNKDNAKGIEAIEKALANINVEITKLDYKKITDGLNNELGKLKDEYELAVELDADPEMGNLFAEMWGINMENLPHTAKEYADRYTKELNKYLKAKGSNLELPNLLNLTKDDMRAFQEQRDNKVLNEEWYSQIEKGYKATHDARDKEIKDSINGYEKLLEKYSEYEYKMLQIEKNANNERKTFAMKFGNDSQKSEVIGLVTDIDIEKDPQKKEQLKEQLKKVLTEIAGSDAAKLQLTVAIDNRELQEGAKLAFEEFKKTPDWIIATGDLAGLTDKALRGLINRVEDYKKKAKNLDPKQIKEINRALKALHKQVREGNPFAAIIDVIEQADERAKEYQPELDSIMSDIISLEKEIGDNDPTEEQAEHLKTLKDKWLEVKKRQEETGKVDAKQLTSSINDSIQAASQATKVFTDMMDAIAGEGNNASQTIKDITSVLEKGGQGAAIGAQIGGGYGAIIGAAAGVVTGLVSIFAGAGNRRITEAVEESEHAVKKLENRVESLKGTYDAMTDSAEHSYGAQSAAATLAASSIKEQEVALKRLMLSETKRQLRLEQSRDSKNRDDDKILSLQKDIISQQNEIDSMLRETSRAVEEVVDSLLGISRGSWAEELTDAMISAFKAGEDYMSVFEDSWEEMVQNMVVKTIAAKVIGDALEKNVLSKIEEIENQETAPYRQQKAELAQHKANLQNLRLENERQWLATISGYQEFPQVIAGMGEDAQKEWQKIQQVASSGNIHIADRWMDDFLKNYGDQMEQSLFSIYDSYNTNIDNNLKQAQQTAQERAFREVLTGEGGKATKQSLMDSLSSKFPDFMETWGVKFGQDADKELSALQRGVQGVTEQTAGAIEGYMNGVSQQVYLQSNILQQINIAVQSFNFDAQLGTISQILLQLQTTYQNQQAIRSIMEGWTNASGMAVRVEMV